MVGIVSSLYYSGKIWSSMDDNMAPHNDTIDPLRFEWVHQRGNTYGFFFQYGDLKIWALFQGPQGFFIN